MKNRVIIGLCMMFLLVLPISFSITTYEETSSVSRIVGESPTEMLRQMQRDSIDLNHVTYFGDARLHDSNIKKSILNEQFDNNKYTNPSGWMTNELDSKIDDIQDNELILLETNGEADPLYAVSPYQYKWSDKEITPTHIRNWQLSFETNNPLMLWDSPYAGSYLPKEDTFVSRLVRDTTIIAPTSFSSPQFTKSFVCNLWSGKTIGQVFKDARNFHYNGGSSSSGDNLIGLVLQSYALYGNPRQIISMEFSEADKEKIRSYCNNFLENLAPDIDFLGQEGNYSKFRKHVVFEIPSYAVENNGDFSTINAENAFQNLEFGELVLPLAVRTTHFPINTLITNFSVDYVGDYEELTVNNLPSYELDFVNRTCYEDKANYSIEFENSFAENSQDFIARISPVEIINCTEGMFRLYKKFNYSVDYIALSPVLIKNIDAPILKPVNDDINVSIELLPLTDEAENGSLAIFDQNGNKIWEEEETNTNKTDYNASFTAPNQEGLQTYSVEFMQDNETLNFDEFSIFIAILELSANIPTSLITNPNVEINFISFLEQTFGLDARYYLLHNNDVIEEGEFAKILSRGNNLHTLSFNNLKKEDQSYTLTLELNYLGMDKTVTYLLMTNNIPILFAEAPGDFIEKEIASINYTAIDYDQDPLTVNINDSRFNKENNAFVWQTTYDDSGDYDVLITASDGQLSDSKVLTITVNDANTAPQLDSISDITVNEADLAAITAEASDLENDALTYSINDSRFVQNNNNFTWQTGYNDSGSYDTLLTVSDGELSDSKVVAVTVNNVNRAPQFILSDIDAKSDLLIDESEIAVIQPAFADPDNENNVVNDDNVLEVTINDTRFIYNGSAFEWQTTYEDSGKIDVELTVSDGFLTVTQNVTVNVNNVNRNPTMQPIDNITVIETELVALSLNGNNPKIIIIDPDNENNVSNDDNVLEVTINDTWFAYNDAGFEWTPTTEDSGVYSYKATVSDGLLEDSKDFTVTVLNLNRAPELKSIDNITGNENSIITIAADASDLDNENNVTNDDNNLSFTINDSRFLQNNNIFEFDASFDDSGIIPTTIIVSDGELTDSQEVIVTVLNVNRRPVLIPIGDKAVNENESLIIQLTATDPDNENNAANDDNILSFKTDNSALPSAFDFNPATGLFEWTPAFNDAGNYSAIFNVTDEELSDAQTIAITVNNVNRPPRIASIPITSATEEQLYAYNVVGEDDDIATKTGDTLTFTLIKAPEGMTIDSITGEISWIPTNEQSQGAHNVNVMVSDLEGLTFNQEFTIDVANVNDLPEINSTPITEATEELLYTYDVDSNDDDFITLNPTETHTYSLTVSPEGMSIDSITGLISWIPTNEQSEGTHEITVKVTDSEEAMDTQSFTITVENVNDLPNIASNPIVEATEEELYQYDVDSDDDDFRTLNPSEIHTFSLDIAPTGMTINSTTGTISWTPTNEQAEGSHTITVRVTDVAGISDTQTYDVSVENVNDAPSIISVPLTTATEELLYEYDVESDDDDFRTLNPTEVHIYSLETSPAGMTIDSSTGLIEWIPTNEQSEGSHNIIVKVTDKEGIFDTQSYEINVANVNDPPYITSSTSIDEIDEQTLFTYDVESDDDDFKTLNPSEIHTYSFDKAPAGMTIDSATGLIEWTPATEQAFATYDIALRVTDIEGESDLQNFSIYVVDTTPPRISIASAPSGYINTDGIITFEVFELHDDNPLITITPNTGFSRISFDKNVSTYVANYTDEGLYNVIITAIDQSKNTGTDSSVSFSIDKTAPVTKNKNYTEWQTEDITVPLNANDPISGGVSSGVEETYYIIYEDEIPGSIQTLTSDLPLIDYEDDDNWLEYWSVDVAGNEEEHIIVKEIKLDKTKPSIYLELYPLLNEYPNNEPLPVKVEVKDPVVQGTPSTISDTIYYLDGNIIDEIADLNITLLLGKHNITIYSRDLAGNENSASINFTVFLQLTNDQMHITPEALQITPGVMTSHILFPGIYNASQIFNMTLEGASYDHADGIQDQQLNIYFRRCDVANEVALREEIFDINFVLNGWVYYNDQLVKVIGNDDIKKLVDSEGKSDKKCPLLEITKEINETNEMTETETNETIDNIPDTQNNESNQIIINETTINETSDDMTGTHNNDTNGIIINETIGNVTDVQTNETIENTQEESNANGNEGNDSKKDNNKRKNPE